MRTAIANAQDSISRAQTHAAKAKAAITDLKIFGEKLPADQLLPFENLRSTAGTEADGLIAELVSTQTALKQSDQNAARLQLQISSITDQANHDRDDKNAAILKADEAVHRYHRLKFPVCLLGAGVALFFLMRFRLLAFLPPPYSFIGIAAVPTIVFGALWLRL